MTWEIILAAITLLGTIFSVYKWWLKSKDSRDAEKSAKAINDHQKQVRLSVKDAEKSSKKWDKHKEKIADGSMPRDDLNSVRSGKRPGR